MNRIFVTCKMTAGLLSALLICSAVEARGVGGALVALELGSAMASAHVKEYGPNVLGPTELVQCLKTQSWIEQSSSKLSLSHAALESVTLRLETQHKHLQAAQRAVNFDSEQSVSAFNANNTKFLTATEQYYALAEAFNAAVDSFNTTVKPFNSTCGGKSYYLDDYASAAAKAGVPSPQIHSLSSIAYKNQ